MVYKTQEIQPSRNRVNPFNAGCSKLLLFEEFSAILV